MKLGIQPMGEEASNQAKGTISSQDIPKGSKVEQYTTIKYYISKGAQQITIPDVDGQTGVDAQQTLEDLGLQVNVQKEYSDTDDNGYALVDPGYVYNVEPAAGTSVQASSSVTLTVSRGVDYGDNAEVPSVVGMTKDDALTTLGKFIDIQITEQQLQVQLSHRIRKPMRQQTRISRSALPSAPVTRLHPQTAQHLQIVQHLQTVQHLRTAQYPQLHLQQMSMQTQAGNVHRHWIPRPATMEARSVWN